MTRGPSKQFDTEVALSKAMDVFWEHGYEAASLSQLLKQMGIGKKSLYDTFGDKRQLYLRAMDRYSERLGVLLHEGLLRRDAGLAEIRGQFEIGLATVCDEHSPKACLMAQSALDDGRAAALATKVRMLRSIAGPFASRRNVISLPDP